MNAIGTSVTYDLTSADQDGTFPPSALPLLFGHMVKISQPFIAAYHSDLYHDAMWLNRHVAGEASFYWMPRECGTNIGTDPKLVGHGSNGALFRVDVHREPERGLMWQVTFTDANVADSEPTVLVRKASARQIAALINAGFHVDVTYNGVRVPNAAVRPATGNGAVFFAHDAAVQVPLDDEVEFAADVTLPKEDS